MKLTVVLIVLLFLISCDEQFGLNQNKISQDVINSSLSMFDGDIVEQVGMRLDGIEVWRVRIENTRGAIVSFYWQKKLHKSL